MAEPEGDATATNTCSKYTQLDLQRSSITLPNSRESFQLASSLLSERKAERLISLYKYIVTASLFSSRILFFSGRDQAQATTNMV